VGDADGCRPISWQSRNYTKIGNGQIVKMDLKMIPLAIMGMVGMGIVLLVLIFVLRAWWTTPFNVLGFGAAPEQPIAFPHTVHVDEMGIACEFCHRNVTTGEAATVPSVEQCMFCHTTVQGEQAPPEVAKLVEYFEAGNPINWGRVHRMPDHVQFVHEAHVRFFTQEKGFTVEETCTVCHSKVRDMEVVEQKRSLKMGDCVDCHRDNNGPTDCATCHY